MSQTPSLVALFRSSKRKAQSVNKNFKPQWQYNDSKSLWESSNDSYVKLGPISMLSLTHIEQDLLKCLAIYRLQHFGCEISKFIMKASRKRTVEYRSSIYAGDSTYTSVLPMIDIGPNAFKAAQHKTGSDKGYNLKSFPLSGLTTPNLKECNESLLLDALALSSTTDSSLIGEEKVSNVDTKEIVMRCCSFLKRKGLSTEGIFRIPASKRRILEIKEKIKTCGFNVASEEASVHDIAGLLKEILRDMPEPLLPTELYDAFMATTKLFHREQVRAIQLMICMVPREEKEILFELLAFLHRIHTCSSPTIDKYSGALLSGNRMDSKNLAIVFSPNLIRRTKNRLGTRSQSLADIDAASEVVQLMIEHYETLLKLPSTMHNEIVKLLSNLRSEMLSPTIFYKIANQYGITLSRTSTIDKQFMERLDLKSISSQTFGSAHDIRASFNSLNLQFIENERFRLSPGFSRASTSVFDGVLINHDLRKPSQPNKLHRYANFLSSLSIPSWSHTARDPIILISSAFPKNYTILCALIRCILNFVSPSHQTISRRRKNKKKIEQKKRSSSLSYVIRYFKKDENSFGS